MDSVERFLSLLMNRVCKVAAFSVGFPPEMNKTAADEHCSYTPWLVIQYVLAVARIRLAKWSKLACD